MTANETLGYADSYFLWVEGSPSAAENPPHDRRWRAAVAEAADRQAPAVEVELDFLLEARRRVIDIDNLARLALAGLRDAGTLSPGFAALDMILATKRTAPPLGLGVTLVRRKRFDGAPGILEAAELDVAADLIPREEKHDEKRAWREIVRETVSGTIGRGPVAVDIFARTSNSLAELLKPVIDGLEPYLGRRTLGGGEFRPLDERIVMLRVRRDPDLPVALHVVAGPPSMSIDARIPPPAPRLPRMDPDFSFSTSDLESMARDKAWLRIFAAPPRWHVA